MLQTLLGVLSGRGLSGLDPEPRAVPVTVTEARLCGLWWASSFGFTTILFGWTLSNFFSTLLGLEFLSSVLDLLAMDLGSLVGSGIISSFDLFTFFTINAVPSSGSSQVHLLLVVLRAFCAGFKLSELLPLDKDLVTLLPFCKTPLEFLCCKVDCLSSVFITFLDKDVFLTTPVLDPPWSGGFPLWPLPISFITLCLIFAFLLSSTEDVSDVLVFTTELLSDSSFSSAFSSSGISAVAKSLESKCFIFFWMCLFFTSFSRSVWLSDWLTFLLPGWLSSILDWFSFCFVWFSLLLLSFSSLPAVFSWLVPCWSFCLLSVGVGGGGRGLFPEGDWGAFCWEWTGWLTGAGWSLFPNDGDDGGWGGGGGGLTIKKKTLF